MRDSRRLAMMAAVVIGGTLGPRLDTSTASAAARARVEIGDSLRVFYVGRPVGWERYTLTTDATGAALSAELDYIDRGRRTRVGLRASFASDYAPRHVEVDRLADSSRTPMTRIDVEGRHATILRNGTTTTTELPAVAFAIAPYTPISQHLALVRYWQSHGKPAKLSVVPGLPVDDVTIRQEGTTTLRLGARSVALTCYAMDGIVWGIEYLWLDADGHIAMFASAGGGLSFKEIRADLLPFSDTLLGVASTAAITDLEKISSLTKPINAGSVALVGATLVPATASSAGATSSISDATVVVANGRIVAAGPSATTPVPDGMRRIDVRGKTIIPGLWDMHAHLHQLEWEPTYFAAGITTVRDMGNELPFITNLRAAVQSGRVNGPTILLAGLVDGPGPNAFGALSASTPAEGRAIVRQYHQLGFEQMKLYSLLSPAVVSAICDEAHTLGMTVTGHIPTSLSLLAAIDSGMDQVAHLPINGDPTSDAVKRTIEHLRAKGTVIDPTVSWNEIGGHSSAEPLQSFQPVTQHLPDAFMLFRAAGWGSATTDTASAHARLSRSLTMVRALHDAGVPIVAGTDEGVPGFSVYREIELYVQGGFTPLEALRAATAVPASAMHMEKDVGTIETGKRADLLVLDANPLDNISNVRRVSLVMKGGALFESAALYRSIGFKP